MDYYGREDELMDGCVGRIPSSYLPFFTKTGPCVLRPSKFSISPFQVFHIVLNMVFHTNVLREGMD